MTMTTITRTAVMPTRAKTDRPETKNGAPGTGAPFRG